MPSREPRDECRGRARPASHADPRRGRSGSRCGHGCTEGATAPPCRPGAPRQGRASEPAPGPATEVQREGRHHDRQHHERVEQHAQSHQDADLDQELQRHGGEDEEGRGQDDARAGDDAAGRAQAGQHAIAVAPPADLLPDLGDQEDVVVEAQRDEEHERLQGDRVRHSEPEQVLEQRGAGAHRG